MNGHYLFTFLLCILVHTHSLSKFQFSNCVCCQGGVLNDSDTLKSEVKHYFSLVNINRQLHSILHVMDVHSADIIENPEKTLLRICEFLEIECDEKYLRDCASIVFPSPSKTRNNVVWPPKVINEVYSHMRKYNFLTRYNFMSN